MAKKSKEAQEQATQTKSKKAPKQGSKKASKSSETARTPAPKSAEIIVDSDVDTESGDAHPDTNAEDKTVDGSNRTKTKKVQHGASTKSAGPSTEDNNERDGSDDVEEGTAPEREDTASELQDATRQGNGHNQDEEESTHKDQKKLRQGVKCVPRIPINSHVYIYSNIEIGEKHLVKGTQLAHHQNFSLQGVSSSQSRPIHHLFHR